MRDQQILSVVTHALGWRFARGDENVAGDNVNPDPIHNDVTHLRDIYFKQSPDYSGRFTVPTLYDVKQSKIVSNEVGQYFAMDQFWGRGWSHGLVLLETLTGRLV